MVEKIRAAGGEIYAITSEPQKLASQAQTEWALEFESIGDPHHEISDACRERGLLDLFVNTRTDLMEDMENLIFRHPKGYFQPGVLALASDGRVLYRWRGIPTRKNMGGATERPTASYVFDSVERALADTGAAEARADAQLDLNPELDSRGIPWPLFVTLLVANGWFIKPKTFGYLPEGPSAVQRVKRAMLRVPLFIGAVGLAFVSLPSWLVGLALVAWAAWLTPQIRFIGSQFQNEAGSRE